MSHGVPQKENGEHKSYNKVSLIEMNTPFSQAFLLNGCVCHFLRSVKCLRVENPTALAHKDGSALLDSRYSADAGLFINRLLLCCFIDGKELFMSLS